MKRYLWLTDTHIWPWQRKAYLDLILKENPSGVFLTGDISNSSQTLIGDLDFFGLYVNCPIYFIPGNHDFHFSEFEKTYSEIRKLYLRHNNLIWMEESGIIELSSDVCCIGNMGWYDAKKGNLDYLKLTLDWILTKDFRKLTSMTHRVEKFKELADISSDMLCKKLKKAAETYKNIYLLSHFPAWEYKTEDWVGDSFFEPYNTNSILGEKLEVLMKNHKNNNLICLMGHTHQEVKLNISSNITCYVGGASSHKTISENQIIII